MPKSRSVYKAEARTAPQLQADTSPTGSNLYERSVFNSTFIKHRKRDGHGGWLDCIEGEDCVVLLEYTHHREGGGNRLFIGEQTSLWIHFIWDFCYYLNQMGNTTNLILM